MATVKCSDCGNEVSTKAEKCPHCGRPKKKPSMLGRLLLILLGVSALGYFLPGNNPKTTTKSQTSPQVSPQVSPVVTPAPKPTLQPPPVPSPPSKENALKSIDLSFKLRKSEISVLEADFTILNKNEYAIKDVKITCAHYAKSGTKIDSNTRTIYEVFPPRKSKTVRDFNMGFIHSQASKSSCEVVDLEIM
jgi:hypothetical protein